MNVTFRSLLPLGLVAVVLAACAPAAVTDVPLQPTAPVQVVQPSPNVPFDTALPTAETLPTQPAESTVPPVATSRGPELHATDPSTVSLAAGGLQLVEFFRFT